MNQSTPTLTAIEEKLRKRWLKFRVQEQYLPYIEDQQKELCIGCVHDHPSQKYHSCLGLGVSPVTGTTSHPVDDYDWNQLKATKEVITKVLGSLIENPEDHVTQWESEDRWYNDARDALKAYWTVQRGFGLTLITKKDQ